MIRPAEFSHTSNPKIRREIRICGTRYTELLHDGYDYEQRFNRMFKEDEFLPDDTNNVFFANEYLFPIIDYH